MSPSSSTTMPSSASARTSSRSRAISKDSCSLIISEACKFLHPGSYGLLQGAEPADSTSELEEELSPFLSPLSSFLKSSFCLFLFPLSSPLKGSSLLTFLSPLVNPPLCFILFELCSSHNSQKHLKPNHYLSSLLFPRDPSDDSFNPSDPSDPSNDPFDPSNDPSDPSIDLSDTSNDPSDPSDDPSDPSDVVLFQVVSSVTASLRFQGALNVDLNEIQTNLVFSLTTVSSI